jgi:deoxycytidylate deaminase
MPTIIGLTGSFGSGCSYFAEHVLKPRGYELRSLSEVLKKRAESSGAPFTSRSEKQVFGDSIREAEGTDALAKPLIEEIAGAAEEKWVVDSIRNPGEVHAFRTGFHTFYLCGVHADKTTRWERVKDEGYDGDWKQFCEDDGNDRGRSNPPHGQRVEDCFLEADLAVTNNRDFAEVGNTDFAKFEGRIRKLIGLLESPLTSRTPNEDETHMAMAYAVSQRSSCLKRKVGAVIVDSMGTVVSTGYNEVPIFGNPCKDEYGKCYRNRLRADLLRQASKRSIIQDGREQDFEAILREQVRMLDVCRALHAEENAIVNLARNGTGVSLADCTMYVTTHPCRMCANKIAQLRLGKVVYLEPYPDEEGRKILLESCNAEPQPFEGVTSKAYFRLYGEKK